RSMRAHCLVAVLVAVAACGGDGGEDEDPFGGVEPLPAPAAGEGFQLEVRAVAPAGTEVWQCVVLDGLPVDAGPFTYLQWGEHRQTPGVHHMDLMALVFANV